MRYDGHDSGCVSPFALDRRFGQAPSADEVPWTDDRRLRRVIQTFRHATQPGGSIQRLSGDDVTRVMSENGVAAGILAAKVYYPTTPDRLDSLHPELSSVADGSGGALRWVASIMPRDHVPGSYWDPMQNPHIIQALHGDTDARSSSEYR